MTAERSALPDFARLWIDLAQLRLGGAAIEASDEFFAPKERLLNPEPAVFIPGKYDENGKWMDGWESRRKRGEGYDHCIVRLGRPGTIVGLDIDTSHFTGNYPPAASLDACRCTGDPTDKAGWTPLVPAQNLGGNAHHFVAVADERIWSHGRLNIYPDGGVPRIRACGRIHRDWSEADRGGLI